MLIDSIASPADLLEVTPIGVSEFGGRHKQIYAPAEGSQVGTQAPTKSNRAVR